MTVTATNLTTNASSTDGGPWTTASVSPSSGKLYLCAIVLVGTNPAPYVGSVTGLGLTWTNVATITGNGVRTAQIYAASGTPSAGALTITQGPGNTATAAAWTVAEISGADTSSGTAGAIVQSVAARVTASTLSTAFTSTVDSANGTFAVIAGPDTLTPTSPWALVGSTTFTSPAGAMTSQFSSAGQQNIQATAPSSASLIPVGIEIKAGSSNLNKLKLGTNTVGLKVGSNTVSKVYQGSTQVWP